MSSSGADPILLRQRFEIVVEIARVNAIHLRHWQTHGGAEFELLSIEAAIAGGDHSEAMRTALMETKRKLDEARIAMDQCEEELAALNGRLAMVDDAISHD
jgi:hypothetical protein